MRKCVLKWKICETLLQESPSLVLFLSLYYINFIVIKEERSGAHT